MKRIGILLGLLILALLANACGSGTSDEDTASPVSVSPTSTETVPSLTTAPQAATPSETTPVTPPTTNDAAVSTTASTTQPSPTPTEPPQCEEDRQAIKAALDSYFAANEQWPTADGQPGLVVWDKIVPDLLPEIPSTKACKWQVSSEPLGEVCRSAHC